MFVSIGAPDPAMTQAFDALVRRAAGNVFMHPAALCAAATTGFAQVHVLSAWHDGALAGFWALRERRIAPFWHFLARPSLSLCVRREPGGRSGASRHGRAGVARRDRGRRKPAERDPAQVARRRCADLSSADGGARGARRNGAETPERTRPYLGGPSERKRSGATGKKLRQDWNRLGARGAVEIVNARDADGARAAFEVFLDLELRSWKGASGTALLCRHADAAFARALIARLAGARAASVALLRLDGRPIAAQVLLYGGSTAYTWKTAFDAEFAKFSPGALLIDHATDALFAGGIAQVEVVLGRRQFHGAVLDRPAHDGRPAARRRSRAGRSISRWSRAASAATRGCAASATGCARAAGSPRRGGKVSQCRTGKPWFCTCPR